MGTKPLKKWKLFYGDRASNQKQSLSILCSLFEDGDRAYSKKSTSKSGNFSVGTEHTQYTEHISKMRKFFDFYGDRAYLISHGDRAYLTSLELKNPKRPHTT